MTIEYMSKDEYINELERKLNFTKGILFTIFTKTGDYSGISQNELSRIKSMYEKEIEKL